jgi:hypothetical protein
MDTNYDKRFPVPSETKSTFTMKNGEKLIIVKEFIDYLHPRTGTIMHRKTKNVRIEGDISHNIKEEVEKWISNGYSGKVPTIIKKYMSEVQ